MSGRIVDGLAPDLRDLRNICRAVPEPLERVLDALSALDPQQKLCLRIDREPLPLYRILANNGYVHQTQTRPDFLYEILIWQAAPGG